MSMRLKPMWSWAELAGSAWEGALKNRLLDRSKPTSIYMRERDSDKPGARLHVQDHALVACVLRVVWELSGEVSRVTSFAIVQ